MRAPRLNLFHLRRPSLPRGVLISLAALAASMLLAGFPAADAPRPSAWQGLLAPLVFWGMVETARCMGRKLNFYFAGVLVLLYSELMVLALVLFFWVYL